jgi:hypothetical protein
MAEPPAKEPRRLDPRARGRRIALAVYYTLVACVGTASAVQITRQVMFEPNPPGPPETCQAGLRSLFGALARAREAAAGAEGGEDAALDRFRRALQPEWSHRDGVASRCRGSTKDAATLDAIERLRYAEEHAVRREAGELAPLRRRVQAIVDSELGR